jgi:hypothetical protein
VLRWAAVHSAMMRYLFSLFCTVVSIWLSHDCSSTYTFSLLQWYWFTWIRSMFPWIGSFKFFLPYQREFFIWRQHSVVKGTDELWRIEVNTTMWICYLQFVGADSFTQKAEHTVPGYHWWYIWPLWWTCPG